MQEKLFTRSTILPENEFIQTAELVQNGRKLAKAFTVGHSEFLRLENELSEFDYEKRQVTNKKIMQHAQIGLCSLGRTFDAANSIYEKVKKTFSVWIGMASALIGRWDIQRHFERANQKVLV